MSFALKTIKQQPLIWLLVLFAAVLLVNGPGVSDMADFLLISSDPLHILAPVDRQFLYSSPLNFFIAALLHLNSVPGYFALHGLEIIGMLLCIGFAVRKKITLTDKQIRFLSLLALTPLFLISMKWTGKTDPVLIGMFFLCWAWRTPWRILFGVLMILSHREMGSLMCLALWFLEEKKDYNLLIAIVAGNSLHFLYQYGLLDQAPQTRLELMWEKAKQFLTPFTLMPGFYILTMFSWYWIVVLLNKPNKKEVLIFGIGFILALFNEDFTRDFVIVTLPALVVHLERVLKAPENDKFARLVPLSVLQIQVAALGRLHQPTNIILYHLANLIY